MEEIILVGTVHVDIKGPERLRKILEIERPDVITIECAKEYFDNYIEFKNYLDKKKLMLKYATRKIEFTSFNQTQILEFNKETLMKFFSITYFEIITVKEYVENNNVKIVCVDKQKYVDEVHKTLNKNLKKGISSNFSIFPPSVFKMSLEYFQKFIDGYYSDESQYKKNISKEDPSKLLDRNKHSVDEILKIKAKKILHVGGVNHIYNNSPNMYELLQEKGKRVRRIKLIDVDDIENE